MENQIMNTDHDIQIFPGMIVFNEYTMLKAQALNVADRLNDVEVTEKNIKESKKLLATVNKSVDALEARRIEIKREMLEPYVEFEIQVKEITGIVKDANDTIKAQVKELEEQERDDKRDQIQEIFNKRIEGYSFGDAFTFGDFIKPQHLNKSIKIDKVEDEMIVWLEGIQKDLIVINTLPNHVEVLNEYLLFKDLAGALQEVAKRNRAKEQANKIKAKQIPQEKAQEAFYLKFNNEIDIRMVKMFCQETNIVVEDVNL